MTTTTDATTVTIEVTPTQAQIVKKILLEIEYQHTRWSRDFDDAHSANDWIAYITKYAGQNSDLPNGAVAQPGWVKVAALAFSAMETYERNNQPATPTAG